MNRFLLTVFSFVCFGLQAEWKLQLDMEIPLPHLSRWYIAMRPICWNSNGKKLYTTVDTQATSLGVVDLERGLTAIVKGPRYPILSIAYKHSGAQGIATCGMSMENKSEFRLWNVSAKTSEIVSIYPEAKQLTGVANGPEDLWGVFESSYGTRPPGQMYVFDGNKQLWHDVAKGNCLSGVCWNEYTGECIFGTGVLFFPPGAIAYNPTTHTLRTLTCPIAQKLVNQWNLKCVKGSSFALVSTFPDGGTKQFNYLVEWGPHQTNGDAYELGDSTAYSFDINDSYVVSRAMGDFMHGAGTITLFDRKDLMNALCRVIFSPNEKVSSAAFNPRNEKQIAVGTDQAVYIYSLVYTNGSDEMPTKESGEAIFTVQDWPQL